MSNLHFSADDGLKISLKSGFRVTRLGFFAEKMRKFGSFTDVKAGYFLILQSGHSPDVPNEGEEGGQMSLAAKWIQLQAQFAFRLQRQQSEADSEAECLHIQGDNKELAQQLPSAAALDLSKTGNSVMPAASIMSFASLIMDTASGWPPHRVTIYYIAICGFKKVPSLH